MLSLTYPVGLEYLVAHSGGLDSTDHAALEAFAPVCGVSPELLAGWAFVVLEVCFDDSGPEGDGIAVIAGYAALATQWAEFSREWRQILDMPYDRWDEVKWSRRGLSADEMVRWRLETFYRIIEKHVLFSFCAGVRRDRAEASATKIPDDADERSRAIAANPYNWAMQAAATRIAEKLSEIDIVGNVDFIFDEKSEKVRLIEGWDAIVAAQTEDAKPFLSASPIFRDSKRFLPIQAADMYAGAMRQLWTKSGERWPSAYPFPWPQKGLVPALACEIDPSTGEVTWSSSA